MKQAVIMCGGLGSRLKKNYPKVLVQIKKKTILEYQLSLFKKHGFKKFLLLTGYKSKMIENFLKRKNMLKNIKIVREKKKLGTGGALLNSVQFLDKEFCLIYGDILTNMKLFLRIEHQCVRSLNMDGIRGRNMNMNIDC